MDLIHLALLYILEIYEQQTLLVFFPNTETDVSALVHAFQGKMKTHWKHSISPAMENCSNTSKVCLSFDVRSL